MIALTPALLKLYTIRPDNSILLKSSPRNARKTSGISVIANVIPKGQLKENGGMYGLEDPESSSFSVRNRIGSSPAHVTAATVAFKNFPSLFGLVA